MAGLILGTGIATWRVSSQELYQIHQTKGYMSATQTSFGTKTATTENGDSQVTKRDAAESMLKVVDKSTQKATGISLFHILTLGAIGASVALFFSGKQKAGIFVGLWPPTFQALKSVVDKGEATT